MRFTALYSGSKGNCYLIQSKETSLLVDCGFSLPYLKKSLTQCKVVLQSISAVFVTHEHVDHINALPQLALFEKMPVYAHEKGARAISERAFCCNVNTFCDNLAFRDLSVDTIECSHDSEYCCGYRFSDGHDAVAIVADTGEPPENIVDFLSPCSTVLLESNHDVQMLIEGKYPYTLKRRILSDVGHLSNKQAGEVICRLVDANGKLKNLVLGHLSQNNNTPELAFSSAVSALTEKGLCEGKDIRVFVASQDKRSETIE